MYLSIYLSGCSSPLSSQKHPQSFTLIKEVIYTIVTTPEHKRVPVARSMAICTLAQLLTKHDYDSRYVDPLRKERIALIYFPLIPLVPYPNPATISLASVC